MSAADDIRDEVERLEKRCVDRGCVVTLFGCVSEKVAAEVIGVRERTLRSWRKRGDAPEHYKSGRVLYPLRGLVLYLRAKVDGSGWQGSATDGSGRRPRESDPGTIDV